MMRRMIIGTLIGSLMACAATPETVPAVLARADSASMETLMTVLREATGRAQITLGPGDVTTSSVISVLPPGPTSLEGNSSVLPEIFELVLIKGDCAVVRKRDGAVFDLPGVKCRVADR